MRTTISIDDKLLGDAKRRAAETQRTLSTVVEDALRAELGRAPGARARPIKEKVVTFRGKGLKPGVNLDSTSELIEVMEGGA